jgi:hypothetical protein
MRLLGKDIQPNEHIVPIKNLPLKEQKRIEKRQKWRVRFRPVVVENEQVEHENAPRKTAAELDNRNDPNIFDQTYSEPEDNLSDIEPEDNLADIEPANNGAADTAEPADAAAEPAEPAAEPPSTSTPPSLPPSSSQPLRVSSRANRGQNRACLCGGADCQHEIDNQIRKCWKCKMVFRSTESNCMKCKRCSSLMCFICARPLNEGQSMDHFYGAGGQATAARTCPAWSTDAGAYNLMMSEQRNPTVQRIVPQPLQSTSQAVPGGVVNLDNFAGMGLEQAAMAGTRAAEKSRKRKNAVESMGRKKR